MARVMAAQATRSPRYLGKMEAALTAPTWWPARPTRCIPLATEGGASIWMTRSMAPMSMPSSSEDVDARHVLNGDFDGEREFLGLGGVDDGDVAVGRVGGSGFELGEDFVGGGGGGLWPALGGPEVRPT